MLLSKVPVSPNIFVYRFGSSVYENAPQLIIIPISSLRE